MEWETLIGGKWALWVGAVAVFFALAFFLAYAWQYLGNAGRLTIGFLSGLAFLAVGGWTRGRVERWFGEGLTGAGLAILYLSTWAGAQRYGLLSFDLAFTLMALTTALGVYLAVHYDAVGLTALATLGGFLTPVLLRSHGGAGQVIPFLSYVAVLNCGILAVSLFKRWRGIIWLSFVATVLLAVGWAMDTYNPSLRRLAFTFVSLYFLLFVGASCFYSLIRREETRSEDLLLLFLDAFIYAMAGYGLLYAAMCDYPGTFPIALALFFGLVAMATHVLAPENAALRASGGGLAILFLTIAIPTQLKQGWIAIGWSAEAAVLATLGTHLRSALLRRAGQVVWALSVLSLLVALVEAEAEPRILFVNERALPLLISVLATGWMALGLGRKQVRVNGSTQTAGEAPRASGRSRASSVRGSARGSAPGGSPPGQVGAPAPARSAGVRAAARHLPAGLPACRAAGAGEVARDELAEVYAVYAVLVGAWLIAQETYLGFGWREIPSPETWQAGALFVIACLWAAYSVAAYVLGLVLRQAVIRFSAFTVATIAVVLPIWAGFALPAADWTPFWNLRWYSYVAVAVTLALLGWLISKERDHLEPSEAGALGLLVILVGVTVLCGVSVETYFGFHAWEIPSPETWEVAAFFLIATFWGVFAAVLLLLGFAWQQSGIRVFAYLVGSAAVVALLIDALASASYEWEPITNLRFLAFSAMAIALAFATATAIRQRDRLDPPESELAVTTGFLAVALVLWGLTQETHEAFRYYRAAFGDHWDRAAQMGISLVWTLYAVMLLLGGILRRYRPARIIALGLLGVTALKVFLFDVSFLDLAYRILSFLGLGLALIGISWLYSRYGIGREVPIEHP